MASIFLTGASGFLGWHFCKLFSKEHTIHGLYFRHLPNDLPGVIWHKLNLLESKELDKVIDTIRPDMILHLAAISKPAFCEQHPTLSHHINVYTSQRLADYAQGKGIPILYTSSDLVFNGTTPPYSEVDFCYPISQYGIQKQMAEECILESCDESYVIRIPLQFGWGPDHTSNFFKSSIQLLQKGETINAFTDEFRSPLQAYTTAKWIEKAVASILDNASIPNVLHIGNKTAVSRFAFMKQVADIYQLDDSLIIPTSQADMNLSPRRPADVSFETQLALQSIDFVPPTIEQQIIQEKEGA